MNSLVKATFIETIYTNADDFAFSKSQQFKSIWKLDLHTERCKLESDRSTYFV